MDLFAAPRRDPITQAIIDAKSDPDRVEHLLKVLTPVFKRIAYRIASQCVEDAVQSALMKVWRGFASIDVARMDTAKSCIMTIGVSGIRDEVRRYLRQHRLRPVDVDNTDKATTDLDIVEPGQFGGVLDLYLEHIKTTGDFHCAHKAVGERLGTSTARATSLFHTAAREWLARYKAQSGDYDDREQDNYHSRYRFGGPTGPSPLELILQHRALADAKSVSDGEPARPRDRESAGATKRPLGAKRAKSLRVVPRKESKNPKGSRTANKHAVRRKR